MSIIIGIDHGYYAIKTAHCSFPAGLTSYGEHEPYTRQGLLEFGGCFFVCGSGRQPIQRDKTVNDNYYLLTLAAIAKEIQQRGLPPECSVRIAAGLPLTSFGRDKPKFRDYLLRSNQPVNFKFEGVEYSITIEEVAVFPQGYAALMTEVGLLQDEPSIEDARKADPSTMPDFQLLCGGFPCQTFSIAGSRKGFGDPRGTLFFELARLAEARKPSYLLFENVPGLLSHDGGRTFATIINTLDRLGYGVEWQCLNSKDFGVPQSRNRVYIVGYLDERCRGKVFPFTETAGSSLIQTHGGHQGERVYSPEGLSCTLAANPGGFGGKTGLYEVGVPIKCATKTGYQMAQVGDSIDLSYATVNSRRGRVGKEIAHTLTTGCQQGTVEVRPVKNPIKSDLARNAARTGKPGAPMDNRKMAEEIVRLVGACHGHALVLFTSYRQMAEVRALTDGQWQYPTYQSWRNGGKIIQKFKESGNGVLFAAGSCWEGIDFPGDMVSLLIIPKLPFPIPDPVSDYERQKYPTLQEYIAVEIIPEMQKKLRQGFGRAIRTEQDSCVVAILDERASIGGKYHDAALAALPTCPTTEKIGDVQQFIREQKRPDYFL